jgi:hypothetical protein
VNLGPILQRTVCHFFPNLNDWLDALPDARLQEAIIYTRRFLAWWGIWLYLLHLGSRRQLDFDLSAVGTQVLANVNWLAGTAQETRPVHDTLDYFLGHTQASALAGVRTQMVRRLLRMKVVEPARLLSHVVVGIDGTGWLAFRQKHCDRCLVHRHETYTVYLHQVLEAKLLGPDGLVFSMGTAFIENEADAPEAVAPTKQDCELKAFDRLAAALRKDFGQLHICLAGDSLFACGRVLAAAQANGWSYVLTFKEGHLPAVWQEFQALLALCPQNRLEQTTPAGARQVYRWVEGLSYEDDERRTWTFNALLCEETVDGQTTTFAWITDLPVSAYTVIDIATRGGRHRWHMENQGFNRQKHGGFALEHVYSTDPDRLQAYYYLLQIAHILLSLLEQGKGLLRLAEASGRTVVQLFGSLRNIARRLLESLRYHSWEDAARALPPTPVGLAHADTS